MASTKIDDEVAAGRAAADKLANDWDNRDWIPAAPTTTWARAAVDRLGEIIATTPSILRASIKGAGKGASTLSPRPFQGIIECLQNADDLGASRLCIVYRSIPRPELLIVHNGSPVTLANVGAMLLPWLSTKDDDPEASGRFGIGQRTLGSLGGPIAIHASPFHFIMGDYGPETCEPEVEVAGVYSETDRDTMILVPLFSTVTGESVAEAIRELGVDALVFMKSIRSIQFCHLDDPSENLDFAVDVISLGERLISFGGDDTSVELAEVQTVTSDDAAEVRTYRRYMTRRTVKPSERRSNKATGDTTPIGICVPMNGQRSLCLYDRMPLPMFTGLPIGLNAQFDPDSARSTLQPTKWNEARFADLGKLVVWAALEAFAENTALGWSHVPLEAEVEQGDGWTKSRIMDLVATCHKELIEQLEVNTPVGSILVPDLAYEEVDLEPLLTEQDIERLRPDSAAMHLAGRDSEGRWRLVLDELGQSDVVGFVEALEILDGDTERSPDWFIAFASLAEKNKMTRQFVTRASILLEDKTVTACPLKSDTWVLVKRASPEALATRLGLARTIHSAYLEPESSASAFVSKLESFGALFDNRDTNADVFAILGRAPSIGAETKATVRLEDEELLELRNAWAELTRDQRSALGPRIARCIELMAVWYDASGRRQKGWARPVEMYLPAAIDREVDSFAKAAGRAVGLKWADPGYAKLLKRRSGRSAIGAQRLLAAWGVGREPRLIMPSDERVLWTRDTTPASPLSAMQTADQLHAIRSGRSYTHLIDDHWSPDAEAVAADIAKAPVKSRRRRAIAFLATLSRGWDRRYSEVATTFPAYAYNGYWHRGEEVRATWLARLADIKWMPDGGNGLQCPSDLQLQVSGVAPRPNERSMTVAKFDGHILRSGILAALGVKSGPTQRDLVSRLQVLSKKPVSDAVTKEAFLTYQLLAASLRDRSEGVPEGRMTDAQLRNAFRAGRDGPGLLLVGKQWNSPEQVLRGPAIFGSYRAFAPHIEGLESLWTALGVGLPTAIDAIAVLKEMANGPPTPTELGVAIRALTLVSGAVHNMSPQLRTTLRKLPLWTGQKWAVERPIYVLEGEALLAAAPASMAVWRPGLSSFAVLESLLEPLGVVKLSPSDFRATSTPAYGIAEGESLRPTFSGAVSLLRQELVRADQPLLDSLSVDWDELLAAPVVIDPELSIVATLQTGEVVLSARAHVEREPLRLIIRDASEAATAEGAGAAVASLFKGDRQKAAWAWAAVWPRAILGEKAEGALLPKIRADRGEALERLEKLAKQANQRTGKKKNGKSNKSNPAKSKTSQPVQVRKLRELNDLEPSKGTIVNEAAEPTGSLIFAKRRKTEERTFKPGGGAGDKLGSLPVRTVLPPSSDRESMALEAVRRALRLDFPQLNDLRAVRGVGVDAVDELRQCYEIKMTASAKMPTDVTLTASEVEAAKNDPDFFLAIVSGLEEGVGQLRVRFIFDPLATLDVRIRGDLTLTGVDKAAALEFTFQKPNKAESAD